MKLFYAIKHKVIKPFLFYNNSISLNGFNIAPPQTYPAYPVAQPVKTDPTIPTYQGEIYAVPAPIDSKQSPPPEAPLAPPDSEMDDLQARLNALTKQNNL